MCVVVEGGASSDALMKARGLGAQACSSDTRTSEQIMVDMIRDDLGVVIDPQAWRMFMRCRFGRLSPLAHRIHDGKR